MLGSLSPFMPSNAAWKRSFLLGAMVDKADIIQPYWGTSKKEGWLKQIGITLSYAEFAGAAFLAYKALKKEPITKRK